MMFDLNLVYSAEENSIAAIASKSRFLVKIPERTALALCCTICEPNFVQSGTSRDLFELNASPSIPLFTMMVSKCLRMDPIVSSDGLWLSGLLSKLIGSSKNATGDFSFDKNMTFAFAATADVNEILPSTIVDGVKTPLT